MYKVGWITIPDQVRCPQELGDYLSSAGRIYRSAEQIPRGPNRERIYSLSLLLDNEWQVIIHTNYPNLDLSSLDDPEITRLIVKCLPYKEGEKLIVFQKQSEEEREALERQIDAQGRSRRMGSQTHVDRYEFGGTGRK